MLARLIDEAMECAVYEKSFQIPTKVTTFLAFLQQRWPEYLRQFVGGEVVGTKGSALTYDQPGR